jgi:hypothetical protein
MYVKRPLSPTTRKEADALTPNQLINDEAVLLVTLLL